MSRLGSVFGVLVVLGLASAILPSQVSAWTAPVNLSTDPATNSFPDVAVGCDGTRHVVWNDVANRQMLYSARPLGGSWSVPVVVATFAGTTYFADGDITIAVAPDNTVHILYADDSSGDSEIYHRFKPAGGGWSAPVDISQTPGLRSELPNMAITPDGTVHAVWNDGTSSFGICCHDTYYANQPVGSPWSAPIDVSNSGANEYETRIGVGPDNSVHIITAQEDGGPGIQNIYYYTRPQGGAFGPGLNLQNNANMGRNMGGAVKTADGTVHLVYYEGWPGEVMYMSKPACGNWSAPVNLSNNASSSWNPDITADGCGTVHVAWIDDVGGGQILYTGKPLGGAWSAPVNIGGAATSPQKVKLAAAPANGLTTGTAVAVYQCSPGGVSDVFFTEAPLTGCAVAPLAAVMGPGTGGSVLGSLRVVPNPTPGHVRFEARTAATVTALRIYDTSGRLVRTIDPSRQGSGLFVAEWDGRDAGGLPVPAGVYWARTGRDAQELSTRVVMVR